MNENVTALIDLGSNSIRLAIYKKDHSGNYEEIKKEKVAARLITYLDEQGKLSPEGTRLIIDTLHTFQKVINSYPISNVIGFATAVIRQAANQEQILAEIIRETGYEFILLSEYEEAYYGFVGVIDSIDLNDGVTIDIGGGSTEITLFENKEMKHYHSFPFGAVSLNTEFTPEPQVTNKQLATLNTYLITQFQSLPWLSNVKYPIIGIGGTVRNLGRIYQKKNNTKENKLQIHDVDKILLEISSLSIDERSKIKGLSKKRKDIIVPGIKTILTLMEFVQAPYFMYTEKSIRDGILNARLNTRGRQE
ncbi:exopolyphosphatase [Peribacillus sp. SCS-155]|uniref:Ppx/GppA phosphatase family protein n=1 Tax=Peribacillus sedimenti TaxID=3115297 RepID=UPI003906351F